MLFYVPTKHQTTRRGFRTSSTVIEETHPENHPTLTMENITVDGLKVYRNNKMLSNILSGNNSQDTFTHSNLN